MYTSEKKARVFSNDNVGGPNYVCPEDSLHLDRVEDGIIALLCRWYYLVPRLSRKLDIWSRNHCLAPESSLPHNASAVELRIDLDCTSLPL